LFNLPSSIENSGGKYRSWALNFDSSEESFSMDIKSKALEPVMKLKS